MYLSHYKYHIEQLGNRYTLARLLGSGRIADVYLAWDEWEQHGSVVKVIRPDVLDPAMQERFLHETKSAASLEHPHIIRIYNYVLEEILPNPASTSSGSYKIPYIVMEHVTGGDLKRRLVPGHAHTLDATLRIIEPLCAAVQYAHSRGVIHRDIKPENLLFCEHPLKGDQVVLSDFGLACLLDDAHFLLPEARTAAYMAPEQRRGRPQPASDIFSLSVVLYQLCTGQLPSPLQSPKKPTLLNPALPPALDDVILRALSHNPSQRFPSASLFWQAIQNAVGQVPLSQSYEADSSLPSVVYTHLLSKEQSLSGLESKSANYCHSLIVLPSTVSVPDGERQKNSTSAMLDQPAGQMYVKVLRSLHLQISRFKAYTLALFRRVKQNPRKDVLISYHWANRKWAWWIQGSLHEDGYSTVLPPTVLPSDSDFARRMQADARLAKRILIVLSPDYVDVFDNQRNFIYVLRQYLAKKAKKTLLVYVGKYRHEVKRQLESIEYTDLSEADEIIARALLLATVRGEGVQLPGTAPFPVRPPIVSLPEPQHELSPTSSIPSIEIFISHSRSEQDTKLLSVFKPHLSSLIRTGTISHWDDSQIGPGNESVQEINRHLNQANIILLLVSPDYIDSDRCYAEMKQALERYNRGEARVLPIILRPTVLKDTPLGELKALPTGNVSITEWPYANADAAFVNVIEGIQIAIEEFRDTYLG